MILKTIIIVFYIFLVIPNSHADDENIITCIDDYPPYQILGKVPHGSHITALNRLAKVLKKKLYYIEAPNFARCVKMLELGQVDVIIGLNKNSKRDQFAFYAPYKIEDDHVFISSNNDVIYNYKDLKGKVIGVPRGTTYFEKFDNDTSLKKISIQNVNTGIQLLLKKRIDVIITSTFAADLLLTEIEKVHLVTTTIERTYYKRYKSYFGFSKKNKLKLTTEQIISLTTAAFEQGVFREQ
jgi:polar amino acid transport system substrate-binding protein